MYDSTLGLYVFFMLVLLNGRIIGLQGECIQPMESGVSQEVLLITIIESCATDSSLFFLFFRKLF